MNKVILMGRLTKDPEVRYTVGEKPIAVARYSLAVFCPSKRSGDAKVDFFNCVTFGKHAENAEKYLHKGEKVTVFGRLQTGSYTNREGVKINTVDIIVEEQEFAENKQSDSSGKSADSGTSERKNDCDGGDDFMQIPDGMDDELPFR